MSKSIDDYRGITKMRVVLLLFISCMFVQSVQANNVVNVHFMSGQSNMSGYANTRALRFTNSDDDILYYYNIDPFFKADRRGDTNGKFITLADAKKRSTYGPEITFARAVSNADSRAKTAIIKVSQGSSSMLLRWNSRMKSSKRDKSMYYVWKDEMEVALRQLEKIGYTVNIASFSWLQGESDTRSIVAANAYEDSYLTMLNDMKDSLEALGYRTKDMVFLNAQFSQAVLPVDYIYRGKINTAQRNVMRDVGGHYIVTCLLYTSPSPRDATLSRMPSSA